MKAIFAVVVLVLVAVGTFFSVRALTEESASEAQPSVQVADTNPSPDSTPDGIRIDAETEAMMREKVSRTPFEGTINGITIVDRAITLDVLGLDCQPDREATPEEIAASPLDFSVDTLPPGYEVTFTNSAACNGQVVMLFRRYSGAGTDIEITRWGRNPILSFMTWEEDLSPVTVAGKPAVLIAPPFRDIPAYRDFPGPIRWQLAIREDFGLTFVDAIEDTQEDALRIAEGIK